ncbi:MAG: ABC transporter ATP-binding protein [Acidimicrobiales bacterium]|jgi:peptide/nickel transport system ATP-binding protein|nr:ABC transporter ATP-binding protein [Acidimicrobiales bacterium]
MTDTVDTATDQAALAINGLEMSYVVRGTPREVLRGVTFSVQPGEAYGLVGESGCGKSTTAYAALRYLPGNGLITEGSIVADGLTLTDMSSAELREFRARRASMVYQDPVQAMNPVTKVGDQVAEAFTILGQSKDQALASALEALERVKIAAPESVMDRYPYQLSGGMLQRVVIAMALACDPTLLVLDEPTTGLDATVEAEVLDLVRDLRRELNSAVLLIAHNLGVIRTMCDRVGVMYAGRIVEEGTVTDVFDNPSHPYTKGLLNSIPRHGIRKGDRELFAIPGNLPQIGDALPTCVYVERCPVATEICSTEVPPVVERTVGGHWTRCHHPDRIDQVPDPEEVSIDHTVGTEEIIGVRGVSKTFRQRGNDVPALVSIEMGFAEGETLGLVGESGSGKSTLAKTMTGVHPPDEGGAITLRGREMKGKATERVEESIRAIQMVFQNPDSALNRAWTVRRILMRAVTKLTGLKGAEAEERAIEIATSMRLSERHLDMRPRQLSGGLKQRVAIARAFAGDPEVVVCDEPTSALDVSVQAAILNLLAQLQREERTSYLFISHDIGVVRYLADRIAVMYVGRIMELGTTEQLFDGPVHPYTEALLSAVPSVDGTASNRIPLEGDIPSPANPPPGCVFHTRCQYVIEGTCDVVVPEEVDVGGGHRILCHLPVDQLPVPVELTAKT